jgi:hypothetical protein
MNAFAPGVAETTFKELKMHRIPLYDILNLTPRIRLSGAFALELRGPTPGNLVAPALESEFGRTSRYATTRISSPSRHSALHRCSPRR